MDFRYSNVAVSGMLSVLPPIEVNFDDESANYSFTERQSLKLKKIMGYNTRRLAPPDMCASDLCFYGLDYLFKHQKLQPPDIDALLIVSQSPDYILPPTSCVLHGKLGLSANTYVQDINQGCAGFVIGLINAFQLLQQDNIRTVVLCNADTLSHRTSPFDRNSYPIVGDGASVCVIKKQPGNQALCRVNFNGAEAQDIIIPAGGFREPCSAENTQLEKDDAGNSRSKAQLYMQGDRVFNFVINDVAAQIKNFITEQQQSVGDFEYFLTHQPNKFILQKLALELGIDESKLPNNVVEHFGNASSPTIPLVACYNLAEELLSRKIKVCLSGFGVGLTCATMLTELGNLDFCEILDLKEAV